MHHRVRAVLGTIATLLGPGLARAQGEGEDAAAVEPVTPVALPAAPPPVEKPPGDGPQAGAVMPTRAIDPTVDVPAGENKFVWEPFGFLRLQYRIVRDDENVEFVGRNDGFELQNARVGVRGALTTRARFLISLDGAIDERERLNDPQGTLRVGLRDAFVDIPVSGSFEVRAGRFRTYVDPDFDATTQREFIDSPIESRGVRATDGYEAAGLAPDRSLGAALRVAPPPPATGGPRFGFELAVQNGADDFASTNDNDTPAISASVVAWLPNRSWVMASGRFNRRTEGDLPSRTDEDDLQGTVGARFSFGPVSLAGGAIFTRTSFPTVGGPTQNAYGAHGQLTFRLGDQVPLVTGYRFGILDPSSLILTDQVMEHAGIFVLGVPAYRMRLQLQLVHVMDQRELTNDRVQFAVEVAL